MRYLVISDTHGNINHAISAIEKEKCDYCIHLGDMVQDCEDLESIFPRQKFIFVKGNNDFWIKNNSFPEERFFTLEGKNFFICHGHRYNVKAGISALSRKAKENNADIVLFGHTHVQFMETHGKITFINPGCAGKYAVITIENGDVSCEVFRNDD